MDPESYYQYVRIAGKLRTENHARRWSDGVLRTLGTALAPKTRRALAKALPSELAQSVKGVFWLLHFRDPNQSRGEFLQRAGRRSGNSNGEFAAIPSAAVLAGLRLFISPALDQQVAKSLAPDLRDYWEEAGEMFTRSTAAH
jgi:uncharacterized protein (DUF2267 family)